MLVVGATFRTAPLTTRERLARKMTLERLEELKEDEDLRDCEFAILSTCNRIEIYSACIEPDQVSSSLLSLLTKTAQSREHELFRHEGRDAIQHLFTVAAGLDSLVKGEAQIVSQISDALTSARKNSLAGPVLSFIFQKAVATGREVRIANPSYSDEARSSMSFSIAKFLERTFESTGAAKTSGGDLTRPNILVLGSGKMAKLAVKSLDRNKVGRIVLAARSPSAIATGADVAISLSEVRNELDTNNIGVVISAISSDGYVLGPEHLGFRQGERGSERNLREPLVIVDMSFPRSVDPAVRGIKGVTLYDLDDLADENVLVQLGNSSSYTSYLAKAEEMVKRRSSECIQALNEQNSGVDAILSQIYSTAEEIRSYEVKSAMEKMAGLSTNDRRILDVMSQRIVRRLLSIPAEKLRAVARKEPEYFSNKYVEVARDLFSLKE